jgi:hypothetical protein
MQHVTCSMDRTSGGTTSPWHYTITWGIYCLQRWALQRFWRPGCPASPPQGDTLTLSLIHQLLCTNIYQHVSQHLQPHHTILDIEGIRGSSLLETGSKFSFSTVEEFCETSPLLQRTVIQIFGHSPFHQISNPEYSSTLPLKELPNLQKYSGTVLQKQFTVDFLSLLSL